MRVRLVMGEWRICQGVGVMKGRLRAVMGCKMGKLTGKEGGLMFL